MDGGHSSISGDDLRDDCELALACLSSEPTLRSGVHRFYPSDEASLSKYRPGVERDPQSAIGPELLTSVDTGRVLSEEPEVGIECHGIFVAGHRCEHG